MSDEKTPDVTALFSPEAEGAVVGSVAMSQEAARQAITMLEVEDFGDPTWRRCWREIQALARAGKPLDPIIVADAAARNSVEESEIFWKIIHATDHVTTPLIVRHYAEIVLRKAMARRAIQAVKGFEDTTIREMGDVEVSAAELRKTLDEIALAKPGAGQTTAALLMETVDEVDRGPGSIRSIRTGIARFDALGGLRSGNECVIAAQTSVGKTAFALQIASHAARHGHPTLIISLEMSRRDNAERILAHVSQTDYRAIRSHQVHPDDWRAIVHAQNAIAKWDLEINDQLRDIRDIELAAHRWRAASNAKLNGQDPRPGLIVLDYLQIVKDRTAKSREREVAETSRTMKLLAGELDCAVLALSQFSRRVGQEDRPPMLSDLRDSGAVEQDADVVLFITRDVALAEGEATLHVAKNRGGELGVIALNWVGRTQTFGNSDRQVFP